MTKNLETADRIAKLALAITTTVLYLSGIIAGPSALALFLLSILVLLIFVLKRVVRRKA